MANLQIRTPRVTGFSWFPCAYKQMLRWFTRFQVATTCFSCSPPDLNLLVTNFIFCIHENNHCHWVTTQLQLIVIIIIIIYIPVIIGATGIVTRSLKKNLEAAPGKHSIDSLQKTAILGTSHIIRKVLQCEA